MKLRDAPALSVGDVPLENHLAEEEAETKGNEIQAERGKEQAKRKKASRKRSKAKYADNDKVRVAKRVRRLTDREIREEYGIMAREYASLTENVLWCIINKGPLSPPDIAKEIQKKPGDVSGVCTRLCRRLPEIIERDETKRPFVYKAIKEVSPEAAYRNFLARDNTGKKKKTAKRKSPAPAPAPASAPAPAQEEVVEAAVQGVNKFVEEMNRLGVEVTVSGRIDIMFGWQK